MPYGTLADCARVITNDDLDFESTRTRGTTVQLDIVETAWLCPGVGLAKLTLETRIRAAGVDKRSTLTQELTGFGKPAL